MLDLDFQVKTNLFDGPLGLLLYLAERQEMNVAELDISLITDQYLKFVKGMQELNFDVAGDFLLMAANLIYLKSQSCLGDSSTALAGEEGEEAAIFKSRAELIGRLQELRHFQNLGQKLWERPKLNHEVFVRPPLDRKTLANSLLLPMALDQLLELMIDLLKRERRQYTTLAKETLSVKQKVALLGDILKEVGIVHPFYTLLQEQPHSKREDCVVTFMAILELARLKKISVVQYEDLAEIYVEVLSALQEGDLQLVEQFDELLSQ